MTACPMCRRPAPIPDLDDLIRSRRIKGHAAAVLTAVWNGGGKVVTASAVFDEMYADDPDGGPSNTQMYLHLKRATERLAGALAGTGVAIVHSAHGPCAGWRLKITGA